jgi:hypothetical protein
MPLDADRRRRERNGWPDLSQWVIVVITVASMIATAGLVYGKLSGRLDLIEYRLMLIEQRL